MDDLKYIKDWNNLKRALGSYIYTYVQNIHGLSLNTLGTHLWI